MIYQLSEAKLHQRYKDDCFSCMCQDCKALCEHRVCWPTPSEAKLLIDHGFGHRLMLDYWANDTDVNILAPATRGREGQHANFWPTGACTFLTDIKTCEIYPIVRPFESQVVGCQYKAKGRNVHKDIARTWKGKEAQLLVERWRQQYLIKNDE